MPDGLLRRRLAWNLQLYRYVHDLTQDRLSEMLGYSTYKYLGNIEQERRNPTLRSVERFADTLGVDPLDLQQPVPGGRGRRVTVSIDAEADDALVGVLRALAELGLVASIRLLDGTVLEGVPVVVTAEQAVCAAWDGRHGRRTEYTFTVAVGDVTGIAVR